MIKIVDEKSKLDKVRCELEEKELLLCFFSFLNDVSIFV